MSNMLDAAQGFAKSGIAIFPCDPKTKRPLTDHGYLDASDDPQQAASWWFVDFPKAAIGMPTGSIFVIDVDDESVVLPFEVPETLQVRTQNGGLHIYLRAPAGVEIRNKQGIIPNVDIRGHGGYVLVPPSPGYTPVSLVDWPDIPVASGEVVRFVTGHEQARATVKHATDNGTSRHAHALNLGMAHEADKVSQGDGLKELLTDTRILSAIKDDTRRAWELVRTYREGRGYREDKAQVVQATPLDFQAVLNEPDEEIPWLVPGLIARGDSVILAGEPKSGKSLLALEWAMAVASGGSFCGLVDCNRMPVVYLDAENPLFAVKKRIRQIAIPRDYSGTGFSYYSREGFNLSEKRWVAWLLAMPPSFIVMDSLSRLHRGEENSNTAMAQLWADAIIPLTSTGHTVLVLHHLRKPGKEDQTTEGFMSAHRARGASDLMAAVDEMFGLSRRETGISVLDHQLARHADPHPSMDIRFNIVEHSGQDCWHLTAMEARESLEVEFLRMIYDKGRVSRQEAMLALGVQSDPSSTRYQQFKRMQKSVIARGLVRSEKQGKKVVFVCDTGQRGT